MDTSRRKKNSSSGMKGIPEDVMDFIVKSSIYDKLEHIAMKKKLTEVHVKNIIRKVIYGISPNNPCDSSFDKSDDETPDQEPKLTRAKRKELDQRNQNVKFLNFPKSTRTPTSAVSTKNYPNSMTHEMKSIATTEFPEDDDDDEYIPDLDEQMLSDEESILSLLGSPISTPGRSATLRGAASVNSNPSPGQNFLSPAVRENKKCDLVKLNGSGRDFQRALNFSQEQTSLICDRTRSKYSMTDTPLEYLEMSFNPPDITPDMYNTEIENADYKEFILDFVQGGGASTSKPEEDEQGDPEYDLWADADDVTPSLDEIREELRGDEAVQIPENEVNDLMLESYELCLQNDNFTTGQQEPLQCLNTSNAAEVSQEEQVDNSDPIVVTYMLDKFSKEQTEVLQTQLVAHVQLLTQSVLMTCYDFRIQYVEDGCKKMLNEIATAGNENSQINSSLFHTYNLKPALEVITKYDNGREDFLKQKDKDDKRVACRCSRRYLRKFPEIFHDIFLDSLAFPYIQFLPYGVFWICYHGTRKGFSNSEYYLIASGLREIVSDENFFEITEDKKCRKHFHKDMNKAIDSLIKLYGISSTAKSLSVHIRRLLLRNHNKDVVEDNPFVKYVKTGVVNLPKARKIELCGTRQPCPIKDIATKFLPKYYCNMVKKYLSSKGKRFKRSSSNKSPSKKKIILLQDGDMTKIVLPSNHAVVVEDSSSTNQKKYIPSRRVDSNNCVPDPNSFSETDLTLSKSRPVNMVVPTPVPFIPTPVPFIPTPVPCIPAPVPCIPTNYPSSSSSSLGDLTVPNNEIYTNPDNSSFNNNNGEVSSSIVINSPSKFLMNFTLSPLKSSYENFNSSVDHELSQQNISGLRNGLILEIEPSNTNTCGVKLFPTSATASPARCNMPFLMETPIKSSNASSVSVKVSISSTSFPTSHSESNTNHRPSDVLSKTLVRDLSFSESHYTTSDTNAEIQQLGNDVETSKKNSTSKTDSKIRGTHEPIPSQSTSENNYESSKNIDFNVLSSLHNTEIGKRSENDAKSCTEKNIDIAGGEDDDQNDLSFEMNYFHKVKCVLGSRFNKFMELFSLFAYGKKTPKFVYPKICKMIKNHPEMQNEFLVFFNAEQSKKLGKETEHRIVLCAKHLYENKRTPDLIDKAEVLQALKAVMNHPNISETQLISMLKPIISLQTNVLENLT